MKNNQNHKCAKNAIWVRGVNKIFDQSSGIKNISFKVRKGSFHLLIGPNGAGKTTLIRTILRIYKNYSGEVLINNEPTQNKDVYGQVNYISEEPIFPSEFTAYEYLLWSGRMSGRNTNVVKSDIEKMAEKFDLSKLLNKKPNSFSSGQKQKVMLIKILIEKSEIVVMDEPTANLDPSAKIIFFDEIEKMHKQGKTIFISTHNLDEVEKRATWVTVMNKGKIVYDSKKSAKHTLINIFKKYIHNGGTK